MQLEEQDNLPKADGNKTKVAKKEIQNADLELTENFEVENSEIEAHEISAENIEKTEIETVNQSEIDEIEVNIETEKVETIAKQKTIFEEKSEAVQAIESHNAAENEAETEKKSIEIPQQDYSLLDMETLVIELEKFAHNENILSVKNHIEEIKSAFLIKFNQFLDEKKQEYITNNPESTDEFEYNFPLKSKFDGIYSEYRNKKNAHFKGLESNLKQNLQNRLAIIEELKTLINPNEKISANLKQLNDLRERWKNAGAIPKDKYNHVWNNFHFHIENFYDYLHLDREARDLDFKHNLEQKLKIIARTQELVNDADVIKSFRELQLLHKIWKEEIGPVSREKREEIWETFSELTKQMHDKREAIYAVQRGNEVENLAKKNQIIASIVELSTQKSNVHYNWQKQAEKVEALRNTFFSIGSVPSAVNEETWRNFKNAVRDFNVHKNSFYKDIKKEQQTNLDKKNALVSKAKELQESTDFETTTPLMKKIQEDWKLIGHVPKKFSDLVWKEFKSACNHYFDKLNAEKNESEAFEIEAFEKKKIYLETLKDFVLTGDHKTDLDALKKHIENWKNIGKVPFTRRHIEGKFNKTLDPFFEKLSSSKKEGEMMRFSHRIDQLSDDKDSRKLINEKIFLSKKVEEVQNDIRQLENNIQFFAHAKKDNPMVLEVLKSIERSKEELLIWKEKLKQIKNLQ